MAMTNYTEDASDNKIAANPTDEREIVVPLHEERLAVSKRRIDTGVVKVSRTTHEYEQLVDEALAREQVEVERVPIGKTVDKMPSVRDEGDILVVPVVEEVLVVERRLFLKEEVRIKKIHTSERHQEKVTLRKQEASVTRVPIGKEEPSR